MRTPQHNSLFLVLTMASTVYAESAVELNGRQIMDEVYSRHQQYPYVYEEQLMVMRDQNGRRDTRKVHRYSRVEEDGTAKFLLVLDYPEEIRGVAVFATRDPSGNMTKLIYLPAFGEQLLESGGTNSTENFLGTDFSVENIIGETLADYKYIRRQDRNINDMKFFVIDVHRLEELHSITPLRRHFVRQDNYFISRTEHYDKHGRLQKKQGYHDLRPVDGDMWRSGMILMEDVKEQHQTLLKVTRRLFSHDYVPAEMFTAEWLFQNHPYIAPQQAIDHLDIEQDENKPAADDGRLSQLEGEALLQP